MNDPTQPIREKAKAYPGVVESMSCNQKSFKATESKFLFIGPGPKGQGYKAMFKLDESAPQALELAAEEPGRYEVAGSTAWVTVRFTAESPIPTSVWEKWLEESYRLSCK